MIKTGKIQPATLEYEPGYYDCQACSEKNKCGQTLQCPYHKIKQYERTKKKL